MPFELRLKVPFHDVDSMNVVWHGNYIKYFEVARDAFFESRGINLIKYAMETGIIFPIVKCSVKYIKPLRYMDEFFCSVDVVTEARRKITIEFAIRRADDGSMCTKGSTEQVAMKISNGRLEFHIPDGIREALK